MQARLIRAGDVVHVDTRDALVAALAAARPGAEIRIAPGRYRGGLSQSALRGDSEHPIRIVGADPDSPPLIEGGQTGLHLQGPQFVELRDLAFDGATGNGINIDDSMSLETPARHIVLRRVVVRNVGPRGNCDGIKLSGLKEFQLLDCRVEQWGDAGSGVDMVGCRRGEIERCQFLGPGGEQANALQTKGGSSEIGIRRCRIENPGGRGVNIGGSTGLPYFRPRDASYEARNITVEDCEFLGGAAAVAFAGVDGATVQHNTIYRPRRWAMRILQESTGTRFTPCRNGKVVHNLVAFRSDEIREIINIGGHTEPATFVFSGNAWACLDRPQDVKRFIRLPVNEQSAIYGGAPAFVDAEKGDLRILNRGPENAGARPAAP